MKKLAILAFFLFVIGYITWGKLSAPIGQQIVSYIPSEKECFQQDDWKYCIHRAKQGTNGGVAYLLHGRNLDEQIWNDDTFYTALMQNRWTESKVKPPTVVTISFGGFWLLARKGKGSRTGLMEKFVEEVLPAVEAKTGPPTYRAVFGESMGGLNSLLLGLKHPELFKKVAALCPPIYKDVTPYSSLSLMADAIKRTGAVPMIIYGVVNLAREFAADDREWDELAPLRLLSKMNGAPSTEYYLSGDLYDKYGIFEGQLEFSNSAKAKGFNIHWQPIYGGHCAIDVNSISDFLL